LILRSQTFTGLSLIGGSQAIGACPGRDADPPERNGFGGVAFISPVSPAIGNTAGNVMQAALFGKLG